MKYLFFILFIVVSVFVFAEKTLVLDWDDPDQIDCVWVYDPELTAQLPYEVWVRIDSIAPGEHLNNGTYTPMVSTYWNIYGNEEWTDFVFIQSYDTSLMWDIYDAETEEYLGVGYYTGYEEKPKNL